MAWDKGFNFRYTIAYVTDGGNETYVDYTVGAYPQTRNGVTFGWEDAPSQADRNSSLDRRLAGIHYSGSSIRFRVDLPAAGDYIISLALGDANSYQTAQQLTFKDNVTSLATIGPADTPASHWLDATGVDRTSTTWPTSNASITKTFSSTILRAVLDDTAGNVCIAHLFVSQAITFVPYPFSRGARGGYLVPSGGLQ